MGFELKHITVKYTDSDPILNDVDLNIPKGQFLGVTGKAGCGKTTLLETLSGFHKPEKGVVFFDGQNIYQKGFDSRSFRKRVQIVFQFPENQFFEFNIQQEIGFGLKNTSISDEEKESRISDVMQAVGLDKNKMKDLSPYALSGGQKRRLALACAMVIGPEVLLLDEPFSGLDGEGQYQIAKILENLHKNGMTIIMVSHDPDILCELADQIIVLDEGKIKLNGTPPQVFSNKDLCSQLGIGQPETKIASELIGLNLDDDYSYENFINKLEKKLVKKND